MALVTAQQFQAPSILQGIQQGLASRGEIQRQGMLTREEQNKQRLAQLTAEQEAGQLATRQRALGVPAEAPAEETQEQAVNRAIADDPIAGKQILDAAKVFTQAQKEDAAAFADVALDAPDDATLQFLIDKEALRVSSKGEDASEILALKDLPPQQVKSSLMSLKAAALSALQREQVSARGAGAGGAEKAFQPVTLVNPKTKEKILVNPVFDPKTGKSRLEQAAIPEGFEISRETKEEERAADLAVTEEEEIAKVTGRGIGARRQKAINEGIIAADGFGNLRRAKDLLDGIATGGFSNAALKAKRFFGVESANEAELSNRMGKAVLSQLRTTFGAAFTAEEGKSLQEIEANYGKSTAGNKRLINQTMKLVKRAAQRGIRAAIKSGDIDSAKEIEDALAFTLEAEESDLSAQEQAELEELRARFQ
jgi:hypothetical protein